MRFIHLSDLHLGKNVNEFSMIEDQKYILREILQIIDEVKPDGVFLAGDVYDKSVPSAEAVCLFDDFLFQLSQRKLQVFVISGNHDSPERIAFGNRMMDASGIHMSPVYDGTIPSFPMEDAYGRLVVHMLPFVKPVHVRRFFEDVEITNYTEAIECALCKANLNREERNVLICHQFVTGAVRSESEEISVGGLDNVDVEVFSDYDYVALGHIHRPQRVGRDEVRYCGTPLKYSFSEANDKKSVTIVDFFEKGNVQITTRELIPYRDMKELRGSYSEITEHSFVEQQGRDDYYHITLTDEEEITNVFSVLRTLYPNLMKFDYDNMRTRTLGYVGEDVEMKNKSPMELFSEFYELQNGQPMNDEQSEYMRSLIERIWEDER